MFIWILMLVALVTFFVINWASSGGRLNARQFLHQVIWGVAAVAAWRLCAYLLEPYLALEEAVGLLLFIAILCLGYYRLQHLGQPQRTKRYGTGRKMARRKGRKRRV